MCRANITSSNYATLNGIRDPRWARRGIRLRHPFEWRVCVCAMCRNELDDIFLLFVHHMIRSPLQSLLYGSSKTNRLAGSAVDARAGSLDRTRVEDEI